MSADARRGSSAGRTASAAAVEELLRQVAARVEAGRRLEIGAGDAVLQSIVDATVSLFQANASSIALYDAATDRLVFRVAAGEQGSGVIGLSIPTDQGLAGYVYSTGQALALSDVERDRRFGRAVAEKTAYIPTSIVAVPLVDGEGTIGVLEVLDKRDSGAFTLRDVELASVFARQAAIAISASRVERDTASLLAEVARRAAGEAGTPPRNDLAVDAIVAAAGRELARGDDTGLWGLVDAIGRLRRADPAQIQLLSDLIAVLADHAERAARPRRRPRAGRAPAAGDIRVAEPPAEDA